VRITPEQLLDELVDRWVRGEPLAVDELLARAGPESDEVAGLIDRFLERAPRREPTPEALAFVRSLDEPSLLRARQARGLKLDDLVAGLVEKLGLPSAAGAKVRRYYQELELGKLDPSRVAASVWEALAGLLGADAKLLARVPSRAPAPAPMFQADYRLSRHSPAKHREWHRRSAEGFNLRRKESPASRRSGPDEVDRLFGVDPSD
jgi:hypothetical protein